MRTTQPIRIFEAAVTVAIITLITVFSSCEEVKFKEGTLSASASPGQFSFPARIDILLAEDNTGSMAEAYSPIAQQIPSLLQALENSEGWDYRFATTPLATPRALDQIIASKYDGNWYLNGSGLWKPPFPGALWDDPNSMVNPMFFTEIPNYTHFLTFSDIDNTLNGLEPGFETIENALVNLAPQTGFLRDDAMLAIIVVGNGDDTSGINFCTRADGWPGGPCNDGSAEASFEYYRQAFLNLKTDPDQVLFYAAVSNVYTSNCLGGGAKKGTRYQQMAAALNGTSHDICSTPIVNVINDIAQNLYIERLDFILRYVILEYEPDVSTIQVTKNGQSIPEDPVNGWTYEGYQTVYTIDSPALMNEATGYTIELHGTAKAKGLDNVVVDYQRLIQ